MKDAKKFPDFDPALAADLRTSLELFLDDVVSSEASDFRQLLLSDDLFLNGRLAKFYGVDLPRRRRLHEGEARSPAQRAGVLTHPYMLSTFAYPARVRRSTAACSSSAGSSASRSARRPTPPSPRCRRSCTRT